MQKPIDVILVNEHDQVIGHMEKMQAHQEAKLHRAFSVILFNIQGEMLLQQRAKTKYHSANLWTNACCSHPYHNETILEASHRRLNEELGIQTTLETAFSFIYKAPFDNGLTEHEFDHVVIGKIDEVNNFNPEEVQAITFKSLDNIKNELKTNPEKYTVWFPIIFEKLLTWLDTNKKYLL